MYYTTTMARTAKFEIRPAANGQFYWRFVGANGEPVCHSETYTTKQAAKAGIQSVVSNAAQAQVVDLA